MKIFCGKCGSRAYGEDGIGFQDNRIYCPICGNCTPSKYGFKGECGTWLIPPILSREAEPEGENDMAKIGTCGNCERKEMALRKDLCATCDKTAKGLTGAARDKALAEIKRKIQAGEVKPRGLNAKKAKVEGKALPPPSKWSAAVRDLAAGIRQSGGIAQSRIVAAAGAAIRQGEASRRAA